MRKVILVCALILCIAPGAHAIQERVLQDELPELIDEFGQIWQAAPAPPGAVEWRTLASLTFPPRSVGDNFFSPPIIAPEVLELDGTTVKLNGYMVPLQASDEQTHFVLMAYPHACPFHVPAGPGGYVEVIADVPVEVTYDPVLVEGEFVVTPDSRDGLYYRIKAAHPVESD